MSTTTAPSPSPLASPEPWDLVAEGYVAENLKSFESFAREALRLAPPDGGDVVDVAAGPGSLSLLAAPAARRVYAIDFAEAMLAQLRARAAAAGITNVETQAADGQALPFEDARFDAAYSMFGLIFFPDRAKGLRELARVLRPGKRAVVSSWAPSERIPLFKSLFAAMRAASPGPKGPDTPAPLGTADEIRSEFLAAGFRTVDVHEHLVVPGTATPAEWWQSFTRGGAPAVLMRRKMGEDAFHAFSERVVAHMEGELGTSPVEVRLLALLGVGTR
jgi:ubiquinone/menaquinone biosynthesis C-methylase UbiE